MLARGPLSHSIACGYAQEEYSWAMGFGLAAAAMIAGLVTSYVAIVISHIPAALTDCVPTDFLPPDLDGCWFCWWQRLR